MGQDGEKGAHLQAALPPVPLSPHVWALSSPRDREKQPLLWGLQAPSTSLSNSPREAGSSQDSRPLPLGVGASEGRRGKILLSPIPLLAMGHTPEV